MGEYISLKEVTKQYQMGEILITAADKVSFDVKQGEFAVLVGPSGAGKTTVLNILGGIDSCDDGRIVVDEDVVSALSEKGLVEYRKKDIGFVFQFYNLIPNLNARENVALATQISENPMEEEEALRAVGLEDRMNNFPSQLSGGEQQRLSIARALAKRPKLLLCDEPTGALDYNTGKKILKLLRETCKKEDMTVILITHNLAIAPMADRIIRMKNSHIESVELNPKPKNIDEIEW